MYSCIILRSNQSNLNLIFSHAIPPDGSPTSNAYPDNAKGLKRIYKGRDLLYYGLRICRMYWLQYFITINSKYDRLPSAKVNIHVLLSIWYLDKRIFHRIFRSLILELGILVNLNHYNQSRLNIS